MIVTKERITIAVNVYDGAYVDGTVYERLFIYSLNFNTGGIQK